MLPASAAVYAPPQPPLPLAPVALGFSSCPGQWAAGYVAFSAEQALPRLCLLLALLPGVSPDFSHQGAPARGMSGWPQAGNTVLAHISGSSFPWRVGVLVVLKPRTC